MTEDAPTEIPTLWVQAWEAYSRNGNRRDTMAELHIGAAVLRRRLNGYAELTGETLPAPRQKPAPTLTQKHIDTWECVGRLGNYNDAALELGVHLNEVRRRLKAYRHHKGLAKDARPSPPRPRQERKPTRSRTVDERLDAMLVELERARRDGDRDAETTTLAAMHRLERSVYGYGFDRIRRKAK